MNIAVKSRCEACNRGEPVGHRRGKIVHRTEAWFGSGFIECPNWDDECRHAAEGLGYYRVAWWPVRCRNGKLRWLTWIEDHLDGTFSLGNRAH